MSIAAASTRASPGPMFQEAMIRLLLPTDDSTAMSEQTIGDRTVTRVELAPPGPGETAYVFSSGDVVLFVVGAILDDISEVVAALP